MAANYDIIVNGGGIVGATTACALAAGGLQVAVIESHEPEPRPAERDPRQYAITRASERILRNLGVWDAIAAQQPCAFTDMEVWDAAGGGRLHFDSAELAEPCLGHVIEPRAISTALVEAMERHPAIELLRPAAAESLQCTDSQATLRLTDGRELQARLLVAADGAASATRELLGIRVRRQPYRQTSLVAIVGTEHPHRHTAWQRFLPGGPLAFLPLADGSSAIVWTMPEQECARVLGLAEEVFRKELTAAFGAQLGAITACGPRAAWPLVRQHAEQYVTTRAALVGDAAHVIHPLAGQGVNLGLLDAATLAEVVLTAHSRKRDPGLLYVLRRYERWRRGENQLMQSLMDGLNRLFSNTSPVLGTLRGQGLGLVGRVAPLRELLMLHATGLAGDLPLLARNSIDMPALFTTQ